MKNFLIVVLFVGGLAFLAACESRQTADNSRRAGDSVHADNPVPAADSSVRAADSSGRVANDSVRAADNSARNVADRKDSAVTSGDQSNAQADLDITQKIRKSVVADDSLSTNAQNVKIITSKGVVTLRGPVANAEEKANIGRIAQNVAGVSRVDNQIETTN